MQQVNGLSRVSGTHTADRTYQTAFDDLAAYAHLAA